MILINLNRVLVYLAKSNAFSPVANTQFKSAYTTKERKIFHNNAFAIKLNGNASAPIREQTIIRRENSIKARM